MWGKLLGGVAGFAMAGPFGAVVGAALGHAAESGGLGQAGAMFRMPGIGVAGPTRVAAMLGNRDQLFAIGVVMLSAKLAKCDGPVVRAEIDAFKRNFRIPQHAARDIGRLFDHARDSDDSYQAIAAPFADNRGVLEDVLAALFAIARADGPLNRAEENFLQVTCRGFGLGADSWGRARDAQTRRRSEEEDPYAVLGVARGIGDDDVRLAWRKLMRENHPDSLASRGVPQEFIDRAGDKVARINAAWDRIKRERGL
jgi:DnaJ like chaperone protein